MNRLEKGESMSAFIVDKSHINAIIQAGLHYPHRDHARWFYDGKWHELNELTANQTGQMLLDENVKAVSIRYPDDEVTNLPGVTDAEWIIPFTHHFTKVPTPIQAIKLIECLEYQSCEDTEWKNTEAFSFCQYFKEQLIGCLPGYDEAKWDYHDPEYYEYNNIQRIV